MKKRWYVMESNNNIDNATVNWKPVFDVRYVRFEKDFIVAVVRDLNDERLCYCVHPARVKCEELKD